jgi:hypothetical protein
MGSFRLGNKAYLFVADVGDNLRRRSSVSIYLAEEPTSATQDVEASGIEFQFEGGPRDCEAVAFDPTSKSFLLIEKKLGLASDVFELPLKADPNVPRPALRTARRAGSIPVPLVTGVDISPDARLLAVTTYTSIVLYRRMDRESWMEAVKRGGKGIAVPPRRQGEAICFGSDGASLYLTSEKRPCPLFRISLEASAKDGE